MNRFVIYLASSPIDTDALLHHVDVGSGSIFKPPAALNASTLIPLISRFSMVMHTCWWWVGESLEFVYI
jgi:hypothetical protein